MMDVDEKPAESIFSVASSFHNKKSHTDPSFASVIVPKSIDLANYNEHRYHLHRIPIDQLMTSASLDTNCGQELNGASGSNKISRKHGKDGVCVQLLNTGRFVYASSKESVSDIYRALGKEVKIEKNQNKRSSGEQDFDSDSLRKMNDLAISAKEAEKSSSSVSTSSKHVTNAKQDTANNNVFAARSGVSVTKPAVHASRAAAMARMAAMGEEWPEEEELPGMNRPNQTSAINSSTGTLSHDTNKQYNDAMKRTKKVVTAKRKG